MRKEEINDKLWGVCERVMKDDCGNFCVEIPVAGWILDLILRVLRKYFEFFKNVKCLRINESCNEHLSELKSANKNNFKYIVHLNLALKPYKTKQFPQKNNQSINNNKNRCHTP